MTATTDTQIDATASPVTHSACSGLRRAADIAQRVCAVAPMMALVLSVWFADHPTARGVRLVTPAGGTGVVTPHELLSLLGATTAAITLVAVAFVAWMTFLGRERRPFNDSLIISMGTVVIACAVSWVSLNNVPVGFALLGAIIVRPVLQRMAVTVRAFLPSTVELATTELTKDSNP